jgi:hypothetical protein
MAKHCWIIERDYQELKQKLGPGHLEGRNWFGFHHHATLCIAAYGFLVAERNRFFLGPSRPPSIRYFINAGPPFGARLCVPYAHTQLYLAEFLHRPATPHALAFWSQRLDTFAIACKLPGESLQSLISLKTPTIAPRIYQHGDATRAQIKRGVDGGLRAASWTARRTS